MRERKVVKFRVDMFDDTKFKIIDMKPERDLIHYVWTRFITLAGKVNCEGDLYMSKNIPYTIETLAIEFNRDTYQIKLALDVLMELEMIELTEDNIYRVKNFAKHQNIKVKEKIKAEDKQEDVDKERSNEEAQVKKDSKNEIYDNEDKEQESEISQKKAENIINHDNSNLEIIPKDINQIDDHVSSEKIDYNMSNKKNSPDKTPIILEVKKNNRGKKKNISLNIVDEEIDKNEMFYFYNTNEERPLGEGESVVMEWAF